MDSQLARSPPTLQRDDRMAHADVSHHRLDSYLLLRSQDQGGRDQDNMQTFIAALLIDAKVYGAAGSEVCQTSLFAGHKCL